MQSDFHKKLKAFGPCISGLSFLEKERICFIEDEDICAHFITYDTLVVNETKLMNKHSLAKIENKQTNKTEKR